jgi:PIN domain nuclease of toxin-antitoxin system
MWRSRATAYRSRVWSASSPRRQARFLAARGKLAADRRGRRNARSSGDLHEHLLQTGVRVLGLSADHRLAVASLPLHHGDPSDRLPIAQERQHGFTLVTADTRIHAYDVPVLGPLA